MKKFLFVLFLLFVAVMIFSQTVNGELNQTDGKLILKVWGTHYERGYAQGYLMGDSIKQVWHDYIFDTVFMGIESYYTNAVNSIIMYFNFEDKYQNEAQGIIDGMEEILGDLYAPEIHRNFNKYDILFANSLVDYFALTNRDLSGFGCSSLSCWDTATEQSELTGEIMISRFMDWQSDQSLRDNPLLMVQFPAEEDEIPWFSVGFPGLFGALSAVNINNLSAFMNMGNYNYQNNLNNLHSIWLSIRNAIESPDYNSDGLVDNNDVFDAINDKVHSGPFIVHSTDDNFAYVIEVNNQAGATYRTDNDNTIIPDDILLATNHFRKLYAPVYCDRYVAISDSLQNNPNLSIERSWQVISGGAGTALNLQAMQYIPSLHIFKWAVAQNNLPAYQNELITYNTEELFTHTNNSVDENSVDNSENFIRIYPNPAKEFLNINYTGNFKESNIKIMLYNLKGRHIFTKYFANQKNYKLPLNYIDKKGDNLKSGLYFLKVSAGKHISVKKFILIK